MTACGGDISTTDTGGGISSTSSVESTEEVDNSTGDKTPEQTEEPSESETPSEDDSEQETTQPLVVYLSISTTRFHYDRLLAISDNHPKYVLLTDDSDHDCDDCGEVLEACTPNADGGDGTTDITCSVCGGFALWWFVFRKKRII